MKKLLIILLGLYMFSCKAQEDILIYYGWVNSYNNNVNFWNNTNVINDMKKFDVIVLGDGIQDSTHGDFSNTSIVRTGLDTTSNDPEIYGYVSCNQPYEDFSDKCSDWKLNLNVDGIFIDEAGYDYGDTSTNDRETFNKKIKMIRAMGLKSFVNAWNTDDVMLKEYDATMNPDTLATKLDTSDWLLLESFLVNTDTALTDNSIYDGEYETSDNFFARINKVKDYNINVAGVAVISKDTSTVQGQEYFDFVYQTGKEVGIEGIGSSSEKYGSSYSNAIVPYYNRNSIIELLLESLTFVEDSINEDIFYRQNNDSIIFNIDFSVHKTENIKLQ